MRTTLSRVALAIIAALALATTTAQADDAPIRQFARDAAVMLDGILLSVCPPTTMTIDYPAACFEHGGDVSLARTAWDTAVRSNNDLEWWGGPWERYGSHIIRMLRVSSSPQLTIAVALQPDDEYGAVVYLIDATEVFAEYFE